MEKDKQIMNLLGRPTTETPLASQLASQSKLVQPLININEFEEGIIIHTLPADSIRDGKRMVPIVLMWDIGIEFWGFSAKSSSIIKEVCGLILLEALFHQKFPELLIKAIHSHLVENLTNPKVASVSSNPDYVASSTRIKQVTKSPAIPYENSYKMISQTRSLTPISGGSVLGPVLFSFSLRMIPYNTVQLCRFLDSEYIGLEDYVGKSHSKKLPKYLDLMGTSVNFVFSKTVSQLSQEIKMIDATTGSGSSLWAVEDKKSKSKAKK